MAAQETYSRFDFIGKRNIAFILSAGSVVVFWIWVFAVGGLKYGIDFTGGIQHIFKFNRAVTPELLSLARESALAVDPSSQVQNIGKPDEGEVMIQVKGFELVQKATAEIKRAPLEGLEDVRTRLAGFDIFDAAFFDQIAKDSGALTQDKVRRMISDYVGDATAHRLNEELERRFGKPAGRIDLNNVPSAARLVSTLQNIAVHQLAENLLKQMPNARSIESFKPLFDEAGLDIKAFDDKFLLRPPTLEELKTDLREYADQPDRLAETILNLYPHAFRESFTPPAERVISGKEARGLYSSIDDAAAVGPSTKLFQELLTGHFYTSTFVKIKTDQVSSRIGSELRQKALSVISLSLLTMLIYIWIRFEFRFAVGAVITLLHDALTVIPLMSIIGYEYDINLIAAILTIIGYSLNDTIVVYDRIRENMAGMRGAALDNVINTSIFQTLSRTVVTGVTTLLAVLALFFLGGPVLEGFSLALFIGILVGTYSSIFVSSPVVYLWPSKK